MAKWSISAIFGTKKDGYTTVLNKETGEVRDLRNPAQKGALYASELKADKSERTGKKLTKGQRLFRSAYLTARRDNADAYNVKYNPTKHAANKAARKQARLEREAEKAGRGVYVDYNGDRYM